MEAGAPYAELWMGTHPSGPSQVRESGELLREYVRRRPGALGARVFERFGEDLPFLFKVLSVRTALSIQAHPDKARAERLHAERPHVYKDANHKPEMALALTDFEALSGFVESGALAQAFEDTPELKACVGDGAEGIVAQLRGGGGAAEALREAFGKVMRAEKGLVERLTGELVARLGSQQAPESPLDAKDALVLRLYEQYPGDVGVFAAFFLNYIQLKPGEAIYLDANEPHAYVAGDIIEAMATSDNVVRAGLTPKLRDTDVLCEMLTYNTLKPEILRGEEGERPEIKRYLPPFAEFQVEAIEVAPGRSLEIPECPGASILLVQRGGDSTAHSRLRSSGNVTGDASDSEPSATPLSEGGVFFAAANAEIRVRNDGGGPLKIFRCCPNDSVFRH